MAVPGWVLQLRVARIQDNAAVLLLLKAELVHVHHVEDFLGQGVFLLGKVFQQQLGEEIELLQVGIEPGDDLADEGILRHVAAQCIAELILILLLQFRKPALDDPGKQRADLLPRCLLDDEQVGELVHLLWREHAQFLHLELEVVELLRVRATVETRLPIVVLEVRFDLLLLVHEVEDHRVLFRGRPLAI